MSLGWTRDWMVEQDEFELAVPIVGPPDEHLIVSLNNTLMNHCPLVLFGKTGLGRLVVMKPSLRAVVRESQKRYRPFEFTLLRHTVCNACL